MAIKKLESMTKAELIRRVEALEPKQAKPEANPSKTIEIRNRFTNEIIYESKTAATLKEAVEEAVKNKADLSGADLSGANLTGSDLSGADFEEADLSGADFLRADLSGADLEGVNLTRADLWRADLSGADLAGSDLSGAILCYCKMDKKVFKQITEEWFEWEVE